MLSPEFTRELLRVLEKLLKCDGSSEGWLGLRYTGSGGCDNDRLVVPGRRAFIGFGRVAASQRKQCRRCERNGRQGLHAKPATAEAVILAMY